jgi:hypothetical protein
MKSRKPVLPIACTGCEFKKVWDANEKDILQKFGIKKPSKKYEILTTARGLPMLQKVIFPYS